MENLPMGSSEEENQYLDKLIENNFKNTSPPQKKKSDKGNYKVNLSADLMRNGSMIRFKKQIMLRQNQTNTEQKDEARIGLAKKREAHQETVNK